MARNWFAWAAGTFILLAAAACAPAAAVTGTPDNEAVEDVPANAEELNATLEAQYLELRSPDVPDLPFPDNPDPNACGIPQAWGSGNNQAWLTGYYQGELHQPVVYLYDSHLRLNIEAEAPHGSEVEIILFQENPVTDYYLVKIVGAEQPNEGWIPAPFLSFEPVESDS